MFHQVLKFPNDQGKVKTIRGDQVTACRCLMLALGQNEVKKGHKLVCSVEVPDQEVLEDVGKEPEEHTVEELHKVRIGPDLPERYFLLGSSLSEQEKQLLIKFLLDNIEVFA